MVRCLDMTRTWRKLFEALFAQHAVQVRSKIQASMPGYAAGHEALDVRGFLKELGPELFDTVSVSDKELRQDVQGVMEILFDRLLEMHVWKAPEVEFLPEGLKVRAELEGSYWALDIEVPRIVESEYSDVIRKLQTSGAANVDVDVRTQGVDGQKMFVFKVKFLVPVRAKDITSLLESGYSSDVTAAAEKVPYWEWGRSSHTTSARQARSR